MDYTIGEDTGSKPYFVERPYLKNVKKFRDENMGLFIKIWKNLPSLVALVLPLIIEYYYGKIDSKNEKIRRESEEEEKRIMEKESEHNDCERRIQWTLSKYLTYATRKRQISCNYFFEINSLMMEGNRIPIHT